MICQKLSFLCKIMGKTQDDLAKETKMSRITINRFFTGHTRIQNLEEVLKALDIDLGKVIDDRIHERMREPVGG